MFHKRLLKEFGSEKSKIVKIILLQLLGLFSTMLILASISVNIADILEGKWQKSGLTGLCISLVVAIAVRSFSIYSANRISFEAAATVKNRLRERIYDKLVTLSKSSRDELNASGLVQLSTEGVEQLEIYVSKYLPQFFYSLIAPVILFITISFMNIKVAFILLICVPLIPVSIMLVQKFAKKLLAKYWGTYTDMGDSFLECLKGLTTLKIYQADGLYADNIDKEAERFRRITMRVLIMQLNSISIMDIIAYGGSALGIILALIELKNGNISVGQCFFITMISAEFFLPMRLLGSYFHIGMNGNAAADRIFSLLDIKEDITGSQTCQESTTIKFDKVDFGYGRGDNILHDISFSIKQKGLTAIAGVSGSGKSTIASLIMGDYSDYSGSISIGGIQIRELDKTWIRRKCTRVTHNSYLFKGTVRENLIMGNKAADEQAMCTALKMVDMYDTVMEKGGLEMHLEEKAANLSGGQKQRLAIARAILHDSDIYIMDEATSNIDIESENRIMRALYALAEQKTVIVISHRLANLIHADRIYVIQEGTLAEVGTHDELIIAGRHYKDIYTAQKELEDYCEVMIYE